MHPRHPSSHRVNAPPHRVLAFAEFGATMSAAPLCLLRGPLLMATVVAALTLPYLLQLSTQTLVCLGPFIAGVVITCKDVAALAEYSVRMHTATFLDNLVLNDVLKSWFDPEAGWIACWISFFLGSATMYTLPMTDDQRVRLIQSCLWTSPEQAQSILTVPGGFKCLLPDKFQFWLDGDAAEEVEGSPDRKNDDECDCSNKTEDTEPMSEGAKKAQVDLDTECHVPSNVNVHRDSSVSHCVETKKKNTGTSLPPSSIVQSPHPPCPLDVMRSIFKEMASDCIKQTFAKIPDSTAQGVAIVASAALALQMWKSPRSRRLVAGAVEGSVALTFVSVAMGALAAFVTKAHVLGSENQQSSFVRGIVAKLKQAGCFRQVKGIIALLILSYVGRRRARQLEPNAHLWR